MIDLNLKINEQIVMDKIKITMVDSEENCDLYITNENIIFVKLKLRLFQKNNLTINKYSLSSIHKIDGIPFVHLKEATESIWKISFIVERELIQFLIEDYNVAIKIVDKIINWK